MRIFNMENTDSRYPYTYACDLIRTAGGCNSSGVKMSRSEASQVREIFAKVLGMEDEELAKKLADYYIENEQEINEQSSKELLKALLIFIFTP